MRTKRRRLSPELVSWRQPQSHVAIQREVVPLVVATVTPTIIGR